MNMQDPAWVALLVMWGWDPAFAGHTLACTFYGWFSSSKGKITVGKVA